MPTGRLWKFAAAVLIGSAAGLTAFTFGYARGYSYLTNDPQACANCHIMSEHYAAWMKGSHHAVATCNDCHTPHSPIRKYVVKASNGFWHSFYFTVGGFPDPLRITSKNQAVTEAACRYCHQPIVEAIDHGADQPGQPPAANAKARPARTPANQSLSCVRCHAYVGHWVR